MWEGSALVFSVYWRNFVFLQSDCHLLKKDYPKELVIYLVSYIPRPESRLIHIYRSPVRTSQETRDVSDTKPDRLMLFRETTAVYCENHTEHTTATICGQNTEFLNAKAGGTYSYHCALLTTLAPSIAETSHTALALVFVSPSSRPCPFVRVWSLQFVLCGPGGVDVCTIRGLHFTMK
jgi:hypothetical protein